VSNWTHDDASAALSAMFLIYVPSDMARRFRGAAPHEVLREYIEQQKAKDSAQPAAACEPQAPVGAPANAPRRADRGELVRRRDAWALLEMCAAAGDVVRAFTADRTQQREKAVELVRQAAKTALSWRDNRDAAAIAAGHLDSAVRVVRG
jgi:hypothetical protein